MRYVIDGEHKPGCFADKEAATGRYPMPFYFNPSRIRYDLDKRGRKCRKGASGYPWLVFPCMDPACDCTLSVHGKDVWDMMGAGMKGGAK